MSFDVELNYSRIILRHIDHLQSHGEACEPQVCTGNSVVTELDVPLPSRPGENELVLSPSENELIPSPSESDLAQLQELPQPVRQSLRPRRPSDRFGH